MKRTIYIINAILFMGCCLLVSTTTPDVKDIDVNSNMKLAQKEKLQDGQFVKYAGIITSVKKKYTKNIEKKKKKIYNRNIK